MGEFEEVELTADELMPRAIKPKRRVETNAEPVKKRAMEREYTATQRAALLTSVLCQHTNASYSTEELAQYVGLTRSAAWKMLTKIGGVLPIRFNEYGRWQYTYYNRGK